MRRMPPLVSTQVIATAIVLLGHLVLAGSARADLRHPTWLMLAGPLDPQPAWGHRAIHDPVRHRMVIVDGQALDRVWVLALPATDGPKWEMIAIPGLTPPARWKCSAVYDSIADRIVIFGGAPAWNAELGDTWALSLAGVPHWTQITTQGETPPPRDRHTAIFDPLRGRMIVFGGHVYADHYLSDTWALDLKGTAGWTQLAEDGRAPGPRENATAVYDPWHDRMIVYGGFQVVFPTGRLYDDTWALSLGEAPAWDSVGMATRPPGRNEHAAIVDPVGRRMVINGGMLSNGSGAALQDVWALALDAEPEWSPLATTGGSPAVTGHAAIYSPERGSLIQFAGEPTWNACAELKLQTLSWSVMLPPAPDPSPPRRAWATLLVNPPADRMLMFGGWCWHDLWSFNLDGAPGWSPLATIGVAPSCGAGNLVYDPVRNRLLALAGDAYWGRTMDQVWSMSLDEPRVWVPLSPTGARPLGRIGFSLMYDPRRDRILMFGGTIFPTRSSDSSDSRDDLWLLSLADSMKWEQLVPSGTPGARDGHTAIYDAHRDRMIVYEGERNVACGNLGTCAQPLNDVWALSLGGDSLAWREVSAAVPARGPVLIDPQRDRLLVWPGGSTVWTRALEDTAEWRALVTNGMPPTPRVSPGVTWDAARNQMLVFGGANSNAQFGDLYALRFGAVDEPHLVLASAHAEPHAVELVWWGALEGARAQVQRADEGGGWVTRDMVVADAAGVMSFADGDVTPQRRYGYRLSMETSGQLSSETWVLTPAMPAVAGRPAAEPGHRRSGRRLYPTRSSPRDARCSM